MNTINRFKAPLALATALALPILTNGCSSVTEAASGAQGALCCTEFKGGAAIDAKIGGSANAQVAAQAVADFTGIASASIEDLTTACRAIATDLGVSEAEQDKANAAGDKNAQMKAWCSAAATLIGNVKATAGISLKLDVQPPKCEASFSAKANCQAKCSGSAKCDVKATPPTCSSGNMTVACKGECTAKAGAKLKCEGKCSAECKGSCTAQGGVECKGKCEGQCKGAAQGGTGTGVKADGTCDGTCEGTCQVTAPGVTCTGSCNGECGGSCTGSAQASVQCDGECKADFEPIKCDGGEIQGGCKVEATCDANCDASVSAKAQCTPPSIVIALDGALNIDAAAKLKATLEANLPLIFAFSAKLEAMGKVGVTLTSEASVKAVGELKASCVIAIGLAATAAVTKDIPDAISASASITGALK